MASVTRRAGLALLLAAVLIAPSFSTLRARSAHANPAAAVAAACAGPQASICISLALAGISLWVATNGDSTAGVLDGVGQAIAGWFNGLTGEEQEAYADRIRSGQVLVNQQMIDAWSLALETGVLPEGFYSSTVPDGWVEYSGGIGVDAGTGYATNEVFARSGWWNLPALVDGDGICTSNVNVRVLFAGGPNSTGSTGVARIYDGVEGALVEGAFSAGKLMAGEDGTSTVSLDSGDVAAFCSGALWLNVTLQNAAGVGGPSRYMDAMWGEIRVSVGKGVDVERYYFPPEVLGDVVTFEPPAPWADFVPSGAGTFVGVPANPDALIGQSGNITVPLADGSVGTLVGPTVQDVPVPTTAGESLVDSENAGWWEGLFGGVQGALTSIWSRLGAIWDAIQSLGARLADVLAAIQGLVAELIAALEGLLVDLFVPTVDPFATLGPTVTAAVPACVVQGFAGALSGMFNGGASAVSIAIGPYGNVTISDANGWVAPLRSLSSYVAYAGLLAYAVALYRRFFGGGGGS